MRAPTASARLDTAVLSGAPLFSGLADAQLEALQEHLHVKTFPAATAVVLADQPGEVVFIILNGTVKVQVDQTDGTEVILAVLGSGQTIGEMSAMDHLGRSANVVTIEQTTLIWIDRAVFGEYLLTMPRLTYNLARILTARLRVANAQIQALATQDVHGRVARQLLSLAQEYGREAPDGGCVIPLRLTQGDLASLVGASRVRVNQALVLYKERGFISTDDANHIVVRNWAALAQRCQ
jgi:CRP/FNR family transcriptional regulator, cyclic AMP receptor protein